MLPVDAATEKTDTPVMPVAINSPSTPAAAETSAEGTAAKSSRRASSGAASTIPAPSSADVLAAALHDVDDSETFRIELSRGDGSTFIMKCHHAQSISDLHARISKALGRRDVPQYAIRLIYKAKVLSNHPESTLGSYGVADGDTINLCVVRGLRDVNADASTGVRAILARIPPAHRTLAPRPQVRDAAGSRFHTDEEEDTVKKPEENTKKQRTRRSFSVMGISVHASAPKSGGDDDDEEDS